MAPAPDPLRQNNGDPDELHAWLDGEMNRLHAAGIGRRLSADPRLAMRAIAYRAQVEGLHALYDPVLDEPIPNRFMTLLMTRRAETERAHRIRARWQMFTVAAVTMGAAISVLAGALVVIPLVGPLFGAP